MPPKSKKSASKAVSSSSSSSSSSKGRARETLDIKTLALDVDGAIASMQFFEALKTSGTKTVLKLREFLYQGCRRPGKESPFVFEEFLTPTELAGATLFYVPAVHDFVLAKIASSDVYYNPTNATSTHLRWYYADDSLPPSSSSSSSTSSSTSSSSSSNLNAPVAVNFDAERAVVVETLCNTSPEQKSFLLDRLFSQGILQRAFPLARAVVADSAPLSVTNIATLNKLNVPYASKSKARAKPRAGSLESLLYVARHAIGVGSGSDPATRARLLNYWENAQGFRLIVPVQNPTEATRAIPLKDAVSLRGTFVRHLFHPEPTVLLPPAVSSPRPRPPSPSRPSSPSRPPSPTPRKSPAKRPPSPRPTSPRPTSPRPTSPPRKSPAKLPRPASPRSPPKPPALPSHAPPPLPISLPPTEPAGPVAVPLSPPRGKDRPLAKSSPPLLVRMLLEDIMTVLGRGLGDDVYTIGRLTRSRRIVTLQVAGRGSRSPSRGEGKGERKSSSSGKGKSVTTREDAEVIRLYLNDGNGTRLPTFTEWVFSDRFPNAPAMRGVVPDGDEEATNWRATDFPLQTGGGSATRSVSIFTQFMAATAVAVAGGDDDPPPYDDTPATVPALGPRPHKQTAADAKREGEQKHYVRVLEILPTAGTASLSGASERGFVQWIDDAPGTPRPLETAIDFRAAGVHRHMIDEYLEWVQEERGRGSKPKTGRGFQRKPLNTQELAHERKLINDIGTLIDCCTTTANNTQPLVPDNAIRPLFGGTSVLMDEDTNAPYFLHERCLQGSELDSILDPDTDEATEYAQQFSFARIAQRLARRSCAAT